MTLKIRRVYGPALKRKAADAAHFLETTCWTYSTKLTNVVSTTTNSNHHPTLSTVGQNTGPS